MHIDNLVAKIGYIPDKYFMHIKNIYILKKLAEKYYIAQD